MYFQIENTPEHIKKSRRKENVKPSSPLEVCPRLVLAPFSRPPQVVFENVVIGTTCERELEVFNPSKQSQQITLGKALPTGMIIHLPGEWLQIEPETCYSLTIEWTPFQPSALRETIRFTNESRGRFDIIVVLKSAAVNTARNPKGFKTSPGKIKKKQAKKSPVAIYKKKYEIVKSYQASQTTSKTTTATTTQRVLQPSNKENISTYDISMDLQSKCPFDSPSSVTFDSEIFSNLKKLRSDTYTQNLYEKNDFYHQNVYEKSYNTTMNSVTLDHKSKNALKPSNKQSPNLTSVDIFDNLTFTPLKSDKAKNERLEKGPKIVISLNSESELEDSIEIQSRNKENETHSIIEITSNHPQNKWLSAENHHAQLDAQFIAETPTVQNKKLPNTSSPKELTSPNFTINTELSRISDLSFFPQRFSTERKVIPKFNIETYDMFLDEHLVNLQSDTFTKDSPHEQPLDLRCKPTTVEARPPHFFSREKICRQSLFRESQPHTYEKMYSIPQENVWQNQLRTDLMSPVRSISPPLQTIPEESVHNVDKSSKQMATFTIDRTFDTTYEHRHSIAGNNRPSWSKKNIRAEPELRKTIVGTDKFLKPKCPPKVKEPLTAVTNITFDHNKSVNHNVSLQISNVYSQSATVDPFSSTSYFYDEEAVDRFGKEFQRWLNCILTPPADLDSNIEQNVDVGKVWIENRNKEVPVAPTKEQVSSQYHNSHRLASLRRSAKAMLLSPEFVQIFQKLNAQIEKKLIAIRTDRNLHLDVGLQKIVMEIILSYNPLWLRIGLEALYNLILPLRSNSDIEGLTTFIVQRMFKNPYLRNKHSKSNAPNMLLPAYMEAIKKYTLKKFFMLIYFLDQAKNRKLIPHDPCLFCRKAICKESREVIIRFSRELIAGIGDITKHLRPLGYVVTHKQCYLDEYKYAVHNIALDLRDGVRLTKVMEIILMKDGLLCQLRTPAISRLQKIHNVQVAFNALKEANFVIEGDIKAVDIADGHREKTLSLLWQLIHVFRAPLFEKAANIIQMWWRKKYEVILEKRKEEEKVFLTKVKSTLVIQHWWRQILYKRYEQWRIEELTRATTVVQKYYRMWVYRSRFIKIVKACRTIQSIYRAYSAGKQQRQQYVQMKIAATVIQQHYRAYKTTQLERQKYLQLKASVVKLQALCRGFITRQKIIREKAAICIQKNVRKYLARSLYLRNRQYVITVQALYKARFIARQQRRQYLAMKAATTLIQQYYRSYRLVKIERENYIQLKTRIIKLQALCRGFMTRLKYKKEKAAICIQKHFKMFVTRKFFLEYRQHVITVQAIYRARLDGRKQRKSFLSLKDSAIIIQRFYRSYKTMREENQTYLKLKSSVIKIQTLCRGYLARQAFKREKAALCIQKNFRRHHTRSLYLQYRQNVITIQTIYRARLIGKQQRHVYLSIRTAATVIQRFYRSYKIVQKQRQAFLQARTSVIIIQALCRGFMSRQRYKKVKAATCIQKNVRTFLARLSYLRYRQRVIAIQTLYRARLVGKQQRKLYLSTRKAAIAIQTFYRCYRLMKTERQKYLHIKTSTITIQTYFRAFLAGKQQRNHYISLKTSAIVIQRFYRASKLMKLERLNYLNVKYQIIKLQAISRGYLARQKYKREKAAVCIQKNVKKHLARMSYLKYRQTILLIQTLYRAKLMGMAQRREFTSKKSAAVAIQKFYRSYRLMKFERQNYLRTKTSLIKLQAQCRGFLARLRFKRHKAAICIQKNMRRYITRMSYLKYRQTVITIQRIFKARLIANQQRRAYISMKVAATVIQRYYRSYHLAKRERYNYLHIRTSAIKLQAICRGYIIRRRYKREKAALCIQKNVRSYFARCSYLQCRQRVVFLQRLWRRIVLMRRVRSEFLQKRHFVIKLQAVVRAYLIRKRISTEKENLIKFKEEQRRNWAASKIQALFRGHKVRIQAANNKRVANLRRRWREGALRSTQKSLKQRHEEAIEIMRSNCDMTAIICAFESLDLLTEVLPMIYNATALPFVRRVFAYMASMNRSLPSIEVLRSASSLLVNLTRYSGTGHKIYSREHVPLVLKLMLRFVNSETFLFCILSTHLWLFSKYDTVKQDLTEFLHKPESHKLLDNIKQSVDRMKRMSCKGKDKNSTAQPRYPCNQNQTLNASNYKSNIKILYPALEPDYGITRSDRPRYFVDAQQAIACLYQTFNL